MAAVKYVRKRNDVFTYERRIPTKIIQDAEAWQRHFGGKRLWRRSLKTRESGSAFYSAAEAVHTDYERREREALREMSAGAIVEAVPAQAPALVRFARPVTQHDLEMLEADRRRMEARTLEQFYLRAESSAAHGEAFADLLDQYEQDGAERRHAIVTQGFEDAERPWLPSPKRDAREAIEALGLDAPEGSLAFGAVVAAIRRGYLAGAHDVNEMLQGRLKPRIAAPEAAKVQLFSEAVAAYVAQKTLASRTAQEVKTTSAEFVELVGDKPLDALTRADFEAFVEMRANRVVGGKSRDAVARPASASTVGKALTLLRSAIGHAIDRRQFQGPNPALGIKVDAYIKQPDKAVMPDKRPLKVGEINKLLEHPWFVGCAGTTPKLSHRPGSIRLDGAEYWAPITAIFTGCRVSELGGLRVAETLIDDPNPHFVIRDNEYRTTKGDYSRDVPMLDALLELGFADYVQRIRDSGADRLFPDWEPPATKNGDQAWFNSRLVKAWNRTVIPARLGDGMIKGARRDVTFHS
uniref:hypothetical protein n=1 Tax=Sphingobium sp. Sx8-8 TaxID=2933617 RepID=UPI001F5A0224